jgi:hypothetical protein
LLQAGAVGARDQAQDPFAILGADHAREKASYRFASTGRELVEHPPDTRGLQPGKLHGQGFTRGTHVKEPLAAIVGALFLHDVAFIDQLFEHPTERLFGDFENVEQFRNLHAGIAVDEMQHTVVSASETELIQHLIRIADEIAIGEEQKLDEIPIRFPALGGLDWRSGAGLARGRQTDVSHYVSYIDIFRFDCYPQKRNLAATSSLGIAQREVARVQNGAFIGRMRP